MDQPVMISNEELAAKAFTAQSPLFDALYREDLIIQYKRERVRKQVEQYIKPGSTILELNAGTGKDAVYFASKGHRVHATDIATGMLEILKGKIKLNDNSGKISYEQCSYTSLDTLQNKGPYDLIFSNFAGLNCTGELDKVLRSFAVLLNPGGMVTLVVLPKFCLWETLLLFKGKFKTASRRFFAKNGVVAKVEGNPFTCWYYNPSYIIDCLKDSFDVLSLEGLCTIVTPSYITGFGEKYPRIYKFLTRAENKLKNRWPWKYIGDYYIISLRKK